jgi:RNA-binding protein
MVSAADPLALTGAQRRRLRGLAQRLEPVLKVGHAGITDALVAALDEALTLHELVKVRFTAHKEEKGTLAPLLAARTSSLFVTRVGHVAVYYRLPADPSRRKVELGE